ncbi:phosphatidate phosphatase LPIN3 [Dromiciops gliroides]|uniref:phosphatidate phosphatase LPIN3 n=1 Tax=Dromiciops gliroides TaxID=33562 RepID=UPI001CC711B2|nr:phosphatidate phosphatase LPIN3 [Dromiciops gliroides]
MNYVGQLAETVYVTVKDLYEGLNPATLSGGIDVLVVRQPDGSFLCSPFHVRFGKLDVLRSREKVVDIEINGEPVDLQMKLGDNGEAFFVQQLENSEEEVPISLRTSPIPMGSLNEIQKDHLLDLIEGGNKQTARTIISHRKKRRRRKKVKKKEKIITPTENTSSEELEEIEPEISLHVKEATDLSSTSFHTVDNVTEQSKDSFPFVDEECPEKESCSDSLSSEYLTSFKSESEMELRSPDPNSRKSESYLQWHWGKLPQVVKTEHVKLQKPLRGNTSANPLLWEISLFQKSSFATLADSPTVPQGTQGTSGSPSLLSPPPFQNLHPSNVKKFYKSKKLKATQDSPALDSEEKMAENTQGMCSSSDFIMSAKGPAVQEGSDPFRKKKESKDTWKRSQHLEGSDIYLEDLPSLNTANTAHYFPQSEIILEARRWGEPCCSKTNLLQATVARDTNTVVRDASTDHLSESEPEQGNAVELSLCGGLAENHDISPEKFIKYAISYQDLADNPGILDDPNLVVKIGRKHYNWAVAAPMILSLQAFQKSLPKNTIDKLVKEKMCKKNGSWWFSWGLKDMTPEEDEVQEMSSTSRQHSIQQEQKMDTLSVEDDSLSKSVTLDDNSSPPQSHVPVFKKSLRLSSDQIRDLNLREGANDVVFSVTTQYQGTCHCHANIYVWNWYDKVVISDIDGTITKSDALGQILPQLGKDWTQHGIIKLYHQIHLNGYKFLYCSARSIGMADLTKGYLKWVNEQGCALPKGPLLLTPTSLFSALHREVIEKKPELFKIACLTDIYRLFLPYGEPFFAGFGNRASDVYAYLHVGIPKSRIFTVNPQGELVQELIKNHKTTYDRLRETVELIFPPLKVGPSVELVNPEYSQFCFWRNPLLTLHLQDLTCLD